VPARGGREIAGEPVEQLEATVAAPDGVDRDARRPEGLDIAQDRALRDLELVGELPGAHPATSLEQAEQPDQTAGSHGPTIRQSRQEMSCMGCNNRLDTP